MDQDMEVDIVNTESSNAINPFLSETLPTVQKSRKIEWGSGMTTFEQELEVEVSYCQKAAEEIYQNLFEEKGKALILIEKFRTVHIQFQSLDKKSIFYIPDEINGKFLSTLTYSQKYFHVMQNYLLCYQRQQQLWEIGVELHRAVVDVQEIHGLCDKLLKLIVEINTKIKSVIKDLERRHNISWNVLSNGAFYGTEFTKLEHSIYETFSLIILKHPEQILQTRRERPVKLRFFSFNDSLVDHVNLQIYLVNETTVRNIRGVLPTEISTAGTLMMAGKTSFYETLGISGKRKRKYSSDKNRHSVITPVGVELKANDRNYNTNHPYLTMQLPLKIMNVVRNHSGCESIASEKYCFLFVSELDIRGEIIKAWTTTLPVIVTTHISHSERAWATIAWDNAFPSPGRKGFEVRATASWGQFSELLQGIFKKWVGVGGALLKPTHLEWIKHKLKSCSLQSDCSPTYLKISWNEMVREDQVPSFWCWFYRSSLIAQGHLKEVWDNGFIEGFIGPEEASTLLLNEDVPPGTFIVRFSDSLPGSISLVVLVMNGTEMGVCRVTPLEFYKNKAFSEYKASLLTQLNSQHAISHDQIFHWVYPKIEKEVVFAKFYEDVVGTRLNKKGKKPYTGMRTVLDSNVIDGKLEQVKNHDGNGTPSPHSNDATDIVIIENRISSLENVWQDNRALDIGEWVFQHLTDYDFGS